MYPLETMSNICYQNAGLAWIKPICSRTFKKRAIYIRESFRIKGILFRVEEPCGKDIQCDSRKINSWNFSLFKWYQMKKAHDMRTLIENISSDCLVKQ